MQRRSIGQRQLDTLRDQFGIAEEALMDFLNYKHQAKSSVQNPSSIGVNEGTKFLPNRDVS